MDNQIITIQHVSGYVDEKGTVWLNAEDVARGLGWYFEKKKGTEQFYVKWSRVNEYLKEFGWTEVSTGSYIPENIFYRLAMKANNEAARAFQAKIADEILPAIRKHGVYMTAEAAEKILTNPDFILKLAQKFKEAKEECARLEGVVAELKPKADYCEMITQSDEAIPVTVIAKDYGMSAKAFNKLLQDLKLQHKAGKTWVLNQPYIRRGYTVSVTTPIGNNMTAITTYWTQKGRMALYNIVKQYHTLPMVERDDVTSELF